MAIAAASSALGPIEIILAVLMRSDVTRILTAIDNGDPAAAQDLLPLVCEELRRLAAQRLALVPHSA